MNDRISCCWKIVYLTSSCRFNRISVSDEYENRADLIEEGIRAAMFQRGLREESENPELEVQYVISTKNLNAHEMEAIENPASSGIDLSHYAKKYGTLKISIVDINTQKPIWRVVASSKVTLQPRPQSQVTKDIEYILSEFPPE